MIVSIDIGTSYCSICIMGPDAKPYPVDIGTGASMFGSRYSLPSAVFVEDNGNVLVGQAAMNSRKLKPQNFRMEFKRDLGGEVPILLGERSFLPEELYTELFRHMKKCAEKVGKEAIDLVYLTHPASYGKARKEKLYEAAKAAGLFNCEFVSEPTAAAVSYCEVGFIKNGENLLVYDFGGGTFDVSLIRYEHGEFHLLTEPEGLDHCGGIDMDRVIFQDMMQSIGSDAMMELQSNPQNFMRFAGQLSELAIKAKHHLSSAPLFEEGIPLGLDVIPYSLSVERFNQMIAYMVGQTIQTCRSCLEHAGLTISDISSVLLVGGTSRVPLVQTMVEKFAGEVPVYCAADLELTVASGALSCGKEKMQERIKKAQLEEERTRQALEEERLAKIEEQKRLDREEREMKARLEMEHKARMEREELERKERMEREERERQAQLAREERERIWLMEREREEKRLREEEIRKREEAERKAKEAWEEQQRLMQEAEAMRIANTPIYDMDCKLKHGAEPELYGHLWFYPSRMVFVSDNGLMEKTIYNHQILRCVHTSAMDLNIVPRFVAMMFAIVFAIIGVVAVLLEVPQALAGCIPLIIAFVGLFACAYPRVNLIVKSLNQPSKFVVKKEPYIIRDVKKADRQWFMAYLRNNTTAKFKHTM